MQALAKFLHKTGKAIKKSKIGKQALEGADSAKTAVQAAGQYAATKGKEVVKKYPKAGSAAAGAAAGAGTMAAIGADEDGTIKKKKKRPYLDD